MTPWLEAPTGIMNSAAVTALGWALLHFVWQGALAAMALWLALTASRSAAAKTRYALTCGCLLAMVACLPVTWWLAYSPTATAVPSGGPAHAFRFQVAAGGSSARPSLPDAAAPMLQWLVTVWCAGVAMRGIWAAGGWWHIAGA
jgi:hypothetical protein